VIRFRSAAARELVADYRRYERDHPGRGKRFVAAVDVTLARIAEARYRFPLLLAPDVRSAKVMRFPYRVVYVVVDDRIDVIAVAHAKRRPGIWRRRLP